jgi:hypothetical protein
MNEDIFNRAGWNNIPEKDREEIKKYPAFAIYLQNSYSMEQLEASHPKEFKILWDMFTEALIKSRMCEELYTLSHDLVFNKLLKDKNTAIPIITYKEEDLMEYGERGEEITAKYLKMGDEFEAGLHDV